MIIFWKKNIHLLFNINNILYMLKIGLSKYNFHMIPIQSKYCRKFKEMVKLKILATHFRIFSLIFDNPNLFKYWMMCKTQLKALSNIHYYEYLTLLLRFCWFLFKVLMFWLALFFSAFNYSEKKTACVRL